MRTQKQVGFKETNYYYDSNNNLIAEKTDNATYEKYEMYLLLVEEFMIFSLKGILEWILNRFF